MKRPQLTAAIFDQMTKGTAVQTAAPSTLAAESLWGAKAIARFMGISEDTVLRLEKREPTFPVRRRGGRIFTTKTEIVVWLQPSRQDQRGSS